MPKYIEFLVIFLVKFQIILINFILFKLIYTLKVSSQLSIFVELIVSYG
jgi:hypothetical protein